MRHMSLLVTVTHESLTGLVQDRVVNTFAVNQADPADVDAEFMNAWTRFFNVAPAGVDRAGGAFGTGLCNYLSPVLDRTANRSTTRVYEIPAVPGPLGSPVAAQSFTLGPAAGAATALPSEVACVLTLEAAGRADAPVEIQGGAVRPKQRFTGRLFIGPLNSAAVTIVGGVARPANVFQDLMIEAFRALDDDIRAEHPTHDLAVWSRSDDLVRPVAHVSVDNAFDTQRRRGEDPTARRRVALAEA